MAKVMAGTGMIYAFEPNWPNFYRLNQNTILNRCQNIVALNIALSSEKKFSTFNYRDLEFGSSLYTYGRI